MDEAQGPQSHPPATGPARYFTILKLGAAIGFGPMAKTGAKGGQGRSRLVHPPLRSLRRDHPLRIWPAVSQVSWRAFTKLVLGSGVALFILTFIHRPERSLGLGRTTFEDAMMAMPAFGTYLKIVLGIAVAVTLSKTIYCALYWRKRVSLNRQGKPMDYFEHKAVMLEVERVIILIIVVLLALTWLIFPHQVAAFFL